MRKSNLIKMMVSMMTLIALFVITGIVKADVNVLRLYNPHSGEHFWTESQTEKNSLTKSGWHYEGVAYVLTSSKNKAPIYRLYNKKTGCHMYTDSSYERGVMTKTGWSYEGVFGYSAGKIPVYRLYHGKFHMFTTSVAERNSLEKSGWYYDGIGFYSEVPNYNWNYNNIYSSYSGQKDVSYPQFYYIASNGSLQKSSQGEAAHASYNTAVYNFNDELAQNSADADRANELARQNWNNQVNADQLTVNNANDTLAVAKNQEANAQAQVTSQQSVITYDKQAGLDTTSDTKLLTEYQSNLTTAINAYNKANTAYQNAVTKLKNYKANGTDKVTLSYQLTRSSDNKTVYVKFTQTTTTNGKNKSTSFTESRTLVD